MAAKTALVVLAEGCEEMEVVITADVLRIAGIQVTIAGLTSDKPVKGSREIILTPDKSLTAALGQQYDALVLPGGETGAKRMCASAELGKALKEYYDSGKWVACLCGAVTALKAHNIAPGKNITSWPMDKESMSNGYKYHEDRIVVDGNLITSRGPGTSFDFAFKIIEVLLGKDTVKYIVPHMLLPDGQIKV